MSALSQIVGHPANVTEFLGVEKTHTHTQELVSKLDHLIFSSLDSCFIIGLNIIYSNFIHIMPRILSILSIFLGMVNLRE